MRHHAFAAAMGVLTAAILAPCSQSQAASADPTGYWYKPDAERESKIQVFKCGRARSQLCAKIAWLKDPNDSKGQPLHDIRNEDPSMRGRSIVGLTIFTGLTPSAPATWTGKIYNPEDGHTYSATLTVLSRKEIKLRGCKAWLLCGEKQWLRTVRASAGRDRACGTDRGHRSRSRLRPNRHSPPRLPTPTVEPQSAALPPPSPSAGDGLRQFRATRRLCRRRTCRAMAAPKRRLSDRPMSRRSRRPCRYSRLLRRRLPPAEINGRQRLRLPQCLRPAPTPPRGCRARTCPACSS